MERYYYDQRRLSSRGGGSGGSGGFGGFGGFGGGTFKFLFPFLLLIVIGVIAVFGLKLIYSYFWAGNKDAIFLYVVDGQAQIKLWGTEDYVKVYDGTRILQGDEVFVAKDSRVVVEFFDGTIVRLAGGTDVVFNGIYKDRSGLEAEVVLVSGDIWVNKTSLGGANTNFYVLTDNVLVQPVGAGTGAGTIFDVGDVGGVEVVRVLRGSADVDVYSENGGTTVDHIAIEEGSQALFDREKLERFWKFQAPNVVEDISKGFIESPWYVWNLVEDEEPTDFGEEVPAEVPEEQPAEQSSLPEGPGSVAQPEPVVQPEPALPPVLNLGPLTTPVITEVNGVVWTSDMFEEGLKVQGEPIKVEGNVSGAASLFVNGYQLQKFESKEGQESFVYWMKEEYMNLTPGENAYEVYALAPDGTRSSSVFFKVIYEPEVEVLEEAG